MVVQGEFFNAQVSQYCYYEANMKMIRSKLTETQKEILRRESCLAEIALDHEHTFWCKQIIHSLLLRQLKPDEISKRENSIYFNVAGKKVKFGKREFAIITGLKMGDFDSAYAKYRAPDGPPSISKFIKHLGATEEATYDEVMKAYERINSSYSDIDVVSLTLLLLYISFNGMAKRTRIEDKLLHLACDWKSFDEIPWGELSYRATIDSARKSMINALKQTTHPENRTYTLGGFPVAFGVFAYEIMPHLERLRMVQRVESSGDKPRMFRWKGVSCQRREQERKQVWAKRTSDGEKVKITRMKPTPEERENFLQWEQETEEAEGDDAELGGENADAADFYVSYRKRSREEHIESGEKRQKVRHEVEAEGDRPNDIIQQLLERQSKTEAELAKCQDELRLLKSDDTVKTLKEELDVMTAKVYMLEEYVHILMSRGATRRPSPESSPLQGTSPSYSLDINKIPGAQGIPIAEEGSTGAVGDEQATAGEQAGPVQEGLVEQLSKEETSVLEIVHQLSIEHRTPSPNVPVPATSAPSPPMKERGTKPPTEQGVGQNLGPTLGLASEEHSLSSVLPTEAQDVAMKEWMRHKPSLYLWTRIGISLDSDLLKTMWTKGYWLNDLQIDLYTSMLRKRIINMGRKDMSIMESTFDTGMKMIHNEKRDANVDDMALKQFVGDGSFPHDLTNLDFLLFPCHVDGNHWILVKMNINAQKLCVYNPSPQGTVVVAKLEYLTTTMPKIIKACDFNTCYRKQHPVGDAWEVVVEHIEEHQAPSSGDCGIYVLKWAECIIHGLPLNTIAPTNATAMRKQMAYELYVHALEEDKFQPEQRKKGRTEKKQEGKESKRPKGRKARREA